MKNREGLKFLFHYTVCFQFNPLTSNIRLFAGFLSQIIQFKLLLGAVSRLPSPFLLTVFHCLSPPYHQ